MPDRVLQCCDCDREFVFSEAEQQFFQERGFDNDPKRCPDCRKRRRAEQRSGGRRGKGGEPRPAQPSRRGPRPPKPDRPMHDAVCSVCNEPTQVPFVPDGVRPVYCLPCLKKQTR